MDGAVERAEKLQRELALERKAREAAEGDVASLNRRIQLVEEDRSVWPLPCRSWRRPRRLSMSERERAPL